MENRTTLENEKNDKLYIIIQSHKFRNTWKSRYLYQRFHGKQNSYSLTEAILAFHCAAFSLLPFDYLNVVQAFSFYPVKKRERCFCM